MWFIEEELIPFGGSKNFVSFNMAMVTIYLNVMFVHSRIPNLCQKSQRQVTLQHIYTIQAKNNNNNERTENEAKYLLSQSRTPYRNWMFFQRNYLFIYQCFFHSSVGIGITLPTNNKDMQQKLFSWYTHTKSKSIGKICDFSRLVFMLCSQPLKI